MNTVRDVLIIGSGAAAYKTADELLRLGVGDVLVVGASLSAGTSRNAGSDKQTYYKPDFTVADDCKAMARDLFGGGATDGDRAFLEASLSAECFLRLVELGVPFPRREDGSFAGYRTDHDNTQRAVSAGPLTSRYMTDALEKSAREHGATLRDGLTVAAIVLCDRRVVGAIAVDANCDTVRLPARYTVAATGAPAKVYADRVYPPSQTGMTGALVEAGVKLANFSEWQFGIGSTSFRWNLSGSYQQSVPRYVSVDGEGVERDFLTDLFGAEKATRLTFLKGYEWPFDAAKTSLSGGDGSSDVDLAVREQLSLGRRVYLDFTRNPKGYSPSFLPDGAESFIDDKAAALSTPFERLNAINRAAVELYRSHGTDLEKELLPVAVLAQHNNGGAEVDGENRTSADGLYAVGEAAGTHGVYRAGGAALNAGQTGGAVAARSIAARLDRGECFPSEAAVEAAFVAAENRVRGFLSLAVTGEENLGAAEEFFKDMSAHAGVVRRSEAVLPLASRAEELLSSFGTRLTFARREDGARAVALRDALVAAEALALSVAGTMSVTGSRGSALWTVDGKAVPENTEMRNFVAVTDGGKVSFRRVHPLPAEM